jgi:PAS domain S-box-containing protein
MDTAPAFPPAHSRPAAGPDTFEVLFHAYPDALVVTDGAGTIVLANQAATQLLGYATEELVGANVDMLVPTAARGAHASYRRGYAANPRPRPMGTDAQLVARRRDGSEVVVEIALSPLRSGDAQYVVAAIRSIADFPRVKEALRRAGQSEQLARLGRIAAEMHDPMALLERVPAIAAEALGAGAAGVMLPEADGELRVAAVTGSDIVLGEQVPATIAAAVRFVMAAGQSLRASDLRTDSRFADAAAPPGEEAYVASFLAVPLFDRGRRLGVLWASAPQPDRFKAHDLQFLQSLSGTLASALQRAASEAALRHSQRLESIGQLTGGIAHDFNNLLTIIHGNLQVLEEMPGVADDPGNLELVEAATRAAKRGAELTGKLLVFSRRQVLRPSRIDVVPMIRSLAAILQRTVDRRVAIEVSCAGPSYLVAVDAGQLESALLNIAINARDAMPAGGRLHIHVAGCDALPVAVAYEAGSIADAAAGYVAIAIADEGEGMSAQVKARAFEPFFTTKEAGRGTGLGLSVVYGFVTQSHGAIGIDSAPGAGTTVTLYLPRAVESEAPKAAAAVAYAEPAEPGEALAQAAPASPVIAPRHGDGLPAGLRVLLVEDDAEVRRIAATYLQGLGCVVMPAASGEEAWTLLERNGPFDLLLTDIALGTGMRGTRLALEAGRRHPTLAILAMSGYAQELLEGDRAMLERYEMLPKPFDRQALALALQRALRRRGRPASAGAGVIPG